MNEDGIPNVGSEPSSAANKTFADVITYRDDKKWRMGMMKMTSRERDSIDSRGKHSTLLGIWLKKEPSITPVDSMINGNVLDRGSIVSLSEDESCYLVLGVWKNSNKKWWMSLEGDHVAWSLTKTVIEKNLHRLKLKKMVGTKSAEGIMEVKHMSHGDGITVGNVQYGINGCKT